MLLVLPCITSFYKHILLCMDIYQRLPCVLICVKNISVKLTHQITRSNLGPYVYKHNHIQHKFLLEANLCHRNTQHQLIVFLSVCAIKLTDLIWPANCYFISWYQFTFHINWTFFIFSTRFSLNGKYVQGNRKQFHHLSWDNFPPVSLRNVPTYMKNHQKSHHRLSFQRRTVINNSEIQLK